MNEQTELSDEAVANLALATRALSAASARLDAQAQSGSLSDLNGLFGDLREKLASAYNWISYAVRGEIRYLSSPHPRHPIAVGTLEQLATSRNRLSSSMRSLNYSIKCLEQLRVEFDRAEEAIRKSYEIVDCALALYEGADGNDIPARRYIGLEFDE